MDFNESLLDQSVSSEQKLKAIEQLNIPINKQNLMDKLNPTLKIETIPSFQAFIEHIQNLIIVLDHKENFCTFLKVGII